jgi:hypothetical protein
LNHIGFRLLQVMKNVGKRLTTTGEYPIYIKIYEVR